MGGLKSQDVLEFDPETKPLVWQAGLSGVTENDMRGLLGKGSPRV